MTAPCSREYRCKLTIKCLQMLWVLGASRISDFSGISASRSGGESGKGIGGSLGRTCEQVKVLHQGAEPTAGEIARALAILHPICSSSLSFLFPRGPFFPCGPFSPCGSFFPHGPCFPRSFPKRITTQSHRVLPPSFPSPPLTSRLPCG